MKRRRNCKKEEGEIAGIAGISRKGELAERER